MNREQVTQELMRVPGIGAVKAERITASLGEGALLTIEQNPSRLQDIGLGTKDITNVVDHVVGQQHKIRLRTFLDTYALGRLTDKVFERYGATWEKVLHYNPYLLLGFGAPWGQVDALYLETGDAQGELRIGAAIEQVLRKAVEQGHSFLSWALLSRRVEVLLGEHTIAIDQEVTRACLGESQVFVADLTMIERAVAEMLHNIQEAPSTGQTLAKMHVEGILSSEQARAVDRAVTNKVSILTGGPGTGKTTTLKALIALLKASGVKVVLCAPTGRAAKRMSQVTGAPAWTIHRLLGYNPDEGWKRDEDAVLDADFVIIDECSMVDIVLFYHLLKALPVTASLCLVGDIHQLPSVGPGCVLRDLLQSEKIPATRLTEIFRQAQDSGIVMNAHRIQAGTLPECARYPDFTFYERDNATETAYTIIRLVTQAAHDYHLDPRMDIAVLSPMYRGAAGVDALNAALQASLNGLALPILQVGNQAAIRYGDKVMQTRNNYEKGVYNGDIGKVVKVEQTGIVVAFDDEFGPHYAGYARTELEQITLAYAVTVHKSQGGEYPVVIIPLVMEHTAMLQRNLLYTAITRATKQVILVGQREALRMAVENNRAIRRNTMLGDLVHAEMV